MFFTIFASFAITGAFHGTGQHADLIEPAWELPVALKIRFVKGTYAILTSLVVVAL